MWKSSALTEKFNFSGEGSSFLDFSRGDLILLDEENTGETVLNSGWCAGTNERTEERGDFPAEAVYVLPCLNKPPDDILVRKISKWYHHFLKMHEIQIFAKKIIFIILIQLF